jgi:hypothetical protein
MEITDEVRIKALRWFKDLDVVTRTILSVKNYNQLDCTKLSADNIVIIWRRKTGGEWRNL